MSRTARRGHDLLVGVESGGEDLGGVRFAQYYSECDWCSAALAADLTPREVPRCFAFLYRASPVIHLDVD